MLGVAQRCPARCGSEESVVGPEVRFRRTDMTYMTTGIVRAPDKQAAPGIARHDVQAVNRQEERALYAGRQKIYPKLAHGRFRTVKWLVMAVRSEEHTSELQSQSNLVCRLLPEKKKKLTTASRQ